MLESLTSRFYVTKFIIFNCIKALVVNVSWTLRYTSEEHVHAHVYT